MNTIKTVALGVFVVLIGTQCFGAAVNQAQAELTEAVRHGTDLDIDRSLCGAVDIDFVDSSRETPLIIAIVYGNYSAMQKILDRKANVNLAGLIGMTPLIYAAKNAHVSAVKILLDRRALVDTKDETGRTALMTVVVFAGADQRTNDKYFNTVRALVEDGRADLFLVNNQGETALDLARKNPNNDERIFALLTMGG